MRINWAWPRGPQPAPRGIIEPGSRSPKISLLWRAERASLCCETVHWSTTQTLSHFSIMNFWSEFPAATAGGWRRLWRAVWLLSPTSVWGLTCLVTRCGVFHVHTVSGSIRLAKHPLQPLPEPACNAHCPQHGHGVRLPLALVCLPAPLMLMGGKHVGPGVRAPTQGTK